MPLPSQSGGYAQAPTGGGRFIRARGTILDYTVDGFRQFGAECRRTLWEKREFSSFVPGNLLLTPLRLFLLTTYQFNTNQLRTHASGLSFYLLLSLVPLLAFAFLISKMLKLPEMLKERLLELVTAGNMSVVEKISEYADNAQNTALGSVGVLTLFAIGFLLLQRVKGSLNLIWRVERWPGLGPRLIEYVTVMAVTPVMLVGSFSVSTFVTGVGIAEKTPDWFPADQAAVVLAGLSGYLVFLLIILYVYWFLPDTRVRLGPALLGALVGATAMWVVQKFYIVVMIQVANYNLIYGTLAILPLLAVWFYLAWLLFLFGAQLSRVTQYYPMYLERRRSAARGYNTLPYVVLLVLSALLRRYRHSGQAVRMRALRAETGLPLGTVEDAVNRMAAARLIVDLHDDPGSYVPRDIHETTTAADVLHRMELMPGFAEPALRRANEGKELAKAFREANLAMARPLKRLSLSRLAERDESEQEDKREAGQPERRRRLVETG